MGILVLLFNMKRLVIIFIVFIFILILNNVACLFLADRSTRSQQRVALGDSNELSVDYAIARE